MYSEKCTHCSVIEVQMTHLEHLHQAVECKTEGNPVTWTVRVDVVKV